VIIGEGVLMVEMVNSFGEYAGKIWKSLNSDEPQTENRLIETTGLTNDEFYSAVGWLAKENKICKDGALYKLGETNLTSKIGKDAGLVWKILDMWEEVDAVSISRLAHIEETDVFSAVGWLAREGKIDGTTSVKRKGNISFWLK